MLKEHLRVKRAMDTGRAIRQTKVGKGTVKVILLVMGIYIAVTVLIAVLRKFGLG